MRRIFNTATVSALRSASATSGVARTFLAQPSSSSCSLLQLAPTSSFFGSSVSRGSLHFSSASFGTDAATHSAPVTARVGRVAPDFEADAVVGQEFKKIKLSALRGKYVVLFFYPLDFTFVCPSEILAFNDSAAEFKKLNTELLAISVDSKFSHLAWANTPRNEGGLGGNLSIPLISDLTQKISKDYGVLIEEAGHTNRGLFIISDKGLVRHITINDPPVGRSVSETLRLVQAFQYTDKHGEVCPIDWTPGKPTMVPDPIKSKSYFKAVNKH